MRLKKCIACGKELPCDEYRTENGYRRKKCPACVVEIQNFLRNEGIHAEWNNLTPHQRNLVKSSKMLLERMGYDTNRNIAEQFEARMEKRGIIFSSWDGQLPSSFFLSTWNNKFQKQPLRGIHFVWLRNILRCIFFDHLHRSRQILD